MEQVEVKNNQESIKNKKTKLSVAGTVIMTLIATLGVIVIGRVIYLIFTGN